MTHAFDELNVQLPGRMIVLDLIVTLLLREHGDPAGLLDVVKAALAKQEAHIMATTPASARESPFQVFATANESLEIIRRNALRQS